jgi:hypothetical protein
MTVTGNVCDASAFRQNFDTNKYENSFAGAEISSELNNGRGVF